MTIISPLKLIFVSCTDVLHRLCSGCWSDLVIKWCLVRWVYGSRKLGTVEGGVHADTLTLKSVFDQEKEVKGEMNHTFWDRVKSPYIEQVQIVVVLAFVVVDQRLRTTGSLNIERYEMAMMETITNQRIELLLCIVANTPSQRGVWDE